MSFLIYLFSTWGLLTNMLVVIVFGLTTYNTYAKRWSAMSGKFSTKGRITWSEMIPGKNRALISYSYTVNNILYNGVITPSPFRMKKMVELNPKGKEITVYYSSKDPGYSQAFTPPNHMDTIIQSINKFLVFPAVLINTISFFLYWLFSINS